MRRIGILLAVIIAGELIFALPFQTVRFFRPTFLDVFAITNTQLGNLFAAYGIVAALAYFPGGALADRFAPRTLIALSLVVTAGGGFYMATLPGYAGLLAVYAFFGISTVFLLWGAMLKVTREWGGNTSQGLAFGLLDGGRGLVAVLAAGIAIVFFSLSLPEVVEAATREEQRAGFRRVILSYSVLTLFAAAIVLWLVPGERHRRREPARNPLEGMREVLGRPVLWANAGVVVCAYCAFKGLDSYALYAVDVLGKNELEAAELMRNASLLRPVAAVAAGMLADSLSGSRLIAAVFALLTGSYLVLGTATDASGFVFLNLLATMAFAFALRAVYFALMNENAIPQQLTGAAVGFVSFIGFTPEFFFGPITGRILDANPGAAGHLDYFLFLAVVATIGVVVSLALIWLNTRRGADDSGNIVY